MVDQPLLFVLTPLLPVKDAAVSGRRRPKSKRSISFRSDSLMDDGVEDYTHQIAEMIGLLNESSFNGAVYH